MSGELKQFIEAFEKEDVERLKVIINSKEVWQSLESEFLFNLSRKSYAIDYKDRLDHLNSFPFNRGACEGEKVRHLAFLHFEAERKFQKLPPEETLEELYKKRKKTREEYNLRSRIPSRLPQGVEPSKEMPGPKPA